METSQLHGLPKPPCAHPSHTFPKPPRCSPFSHILLKPPCACPSKLKIAGANKAHLARDIDHINHFRAIYPAGFYLCEFCLHIVTPKSTRLRPSLGWILSRSKPKQPPFWASFLSSTFSPSSFVTLANPPSMLSSSTSSQQAHEPYSCNLLPHDPPYRAPLFCDPANQRLPIPWVYNIDGSYDWQKINGSSCTILQHAGTIPHLLCYKVLK